MSTSEERWLYWSWHRGANTHGHAQGLTLSNEELVELRDAIVHALMVTNDVLRVGDLEGPPMTEARLFQTIEAGEGITLWFRDQFYEDMKAQGAWVGQVFRKALSR